jgi:hypothetical protein
MEYYGSEIMRFPHENVVNVFVVRRAGAANAASVRVVAPSG